MNNGLDELKYLLTFCALRCLLGIASHHFLIAFLTNSDDIFRDDKQVNDGVLILEAWFV